MAAPPLFRGGVSLLRLRLRHHHHRISAVAGSFTCTPLRRPLCSSATESTQSDSDESDKHYELLRVKSPPELFDGVDESEYRKWKDNEEVILNDIEPIVYLTRDILHSNRYMDGERLTTEDEKVVVEKLLAYHRHSEDNIGCGLDSIIMVAGSTSLTRNAYGSIFETISVLWRKIYTGTFETQPWLKT